MNGTFLSVLTYDIPGMTLGMAHVISYVLVALEYLIAIWVISRWKHDAAMKTVIVMMVMFICLIAVTWARGLSIDCGCFGHTENVDNPIKGYIEVMIRDAVVALLCLYNMTTLTYVNSAR